MGTILSVTGEKYAEQEIKTGILIERSLNSAMANFPTNTIIKIHPFQKATLMYGDTCSQTPERLNCNYP